MKGIILAGGEGSRLYPLTAAVNKHMLPVYDKPLIYYPISTLMLGGIREVLVISRPQDVETYRALLGDGEAWGMCFRYAVQERPAGIAEAFLIGRSFLDGAPCCLLLGDNVFYGDGLTDIMTTATRLEEGARVFAHPVRDPERYGVVELDRDGRVVALVEKPEQPASNLAVTGLYLFDGRVSEVAEGLEPSDRGELEITDVLNCYLRADRLAVSVLGRGVAWLDAGTHDSLLEASQFVATLQRRQGLMIGSPEEVAYRKGYIDRRAFRALVEEHGDSAYAGYLQRVLAETSGRGSSRGSP